MIKEKIIFLLLIFFLILTLRIISPGYPTPTSDEARIAYRGYTISNFATDELGRHMPFIFNSLTDYQLPLTSYLTALGILLFGKTDIGVKAPFIILSLGILILTYKISKSFSEKKLFWFISTLVLVFSPALIFLSKVPNDAVVFVFLTTLLFFLLIREKLNMPLIIFIIVLSMIVSKFAWFIIPPFVLFTLFLYQNNLSKKNKIKISIFCLLISFAALMIFLRVPQSQRSLAENNLPLFSDVTIQNGINKLRGQGIESGWPPILGKILFNKSYFLIIGFIHWVSNLFGLTQMGALAKILVIPFVSGLIYLIRKGSKKEKLLLVYFPILTFPALFTYPNFSQNLIVLTLPFMALVISFGFLQFKKIVLLLIISGMILEVVLGLLFLPFENKRVNLNRPYWVKEMTEDIYKLSANHQVYVSDDMVAEELVPFIQWYNPIGQPTDYSSIPFPYKFRQAEIQNIKIVGSENEYYSCGEEEKNRVFFSVRDKDKIEKSDKQIETIKVYKDSLNKEIGYLLKRGLCIR